MMYWKIIMTWKKQSETLIRDKYVDTKDVTFRSTFVANNIKWIYIVWNPQS